MKLLRQAENNSPHRHLHGERFPIAAMLVFALSVRPSIGPHVWLVVQAYKIVGVHVGLENDASPVTTVATVRPAARNEFFPPETAAAIAAISSLRVNANMIDEFHFAIKPQEAAGGKFRTERPKPKLVTFS
jgi:hypothetical protein